MRRFVFGLVLVSGLAGLLACVPVAYETEARFGPPDVVLDADQPEQRFRVRLCYDGDPGDEATASLRVRASSPTPTRASLLVDDDLHLDSLADDSLGGASWIDDIDDACETGVVVQFALLDPADPADPAEPVEITWELEARVASFEDEGADSLTLALTVEALD